MEILTNKRNAFYNYVTLRMYLAYHQTEHHNSDYDWLDLSKYARIIFEGKTAEVDAVLADIDETDHAEAIESYEELLHMGLNMTGLSSKLSNDEQLAMYFTDDLPF